MTIRPELVGGQERPVAQSSRIRAEGRDQVEAALRRLVQQRRQLLDELQAIHGEMAQLMTLQAVAFTLASPRAPAIDELRQAEEHGHGTR